MSKEIQLPVWPDFDTLARSMNVRGNLYAKVSDDPLFGVVITSEMWDRALSARPQNDA